jgi:hypothetical protein
VSTYCGRPSALQRLNWAETAPRRVVPGRTRAGAKAAILRRPRKRGSVRSRWRQARRVQPTKSSTRLLQVYDCRSFLRQSRLAKSFSESRGTAKWSITNLTGSFGLAYEASANTRLASSILPCSA